MTDASLTDASLQIGFRRPRFWTPVMLAVVGGSLAGLLGGLALAGRASGAPAPAFVAIAAAATLLFLGLAVAARKLTMAETAPVIRLFDARLVLPRSASSRRSSEIDVADVLTVGLYGKGKQRRLVVGTRRRSFVYPLGAIEGGAESADRLRVGVRSALARRPDGALLLGRMDRRESLGREALRIQPIVTYALLAAIAAAFAWEHTSGALDRPLGLLRLGANSPRLVAEGEWFRLLAANFLHVNWVHIYFNALALFLLGGLLERLVGPWRLLAIYLAGALGGSLLSAALAPALMSAGASTAVFGLLGGLAWVNWRHRERLPAGFFQPLKWWVFIIGLNALLPVLVPQIDYAAHIGGFLAGGAVAMGICRSPASIQPGGAAPLAVRLGAGALAAVFLAGQVEAIRHSLGDAGEGELALVRALIRDDAVHSSVLNGIAWDYVTRPDSSPREIELALEAARHAVADSPTNGAYLDTLATALYRSGDLDGAVETERRAARFYDRRFVSSQLARFLAARMHAEGPIELGGARRADVAVRPTPDRTGIVFEIGAAYPGGLVIYALHERGGRLAGIVEAAVGPNESPARFERRLDRELGADAGLEVALVDASGCDCAAGTFQMRLVPMERRAAELP